MMEAREDFGQIVVVVASLLAAALVTAGMSLANAGDPATSTERAAGPPETTSTAAPTTTMPPAVTSPSTTAAPTTTAPSHAPAPVPATRPPRQPVDGDDVSVDDFPTASKTQFPRFGDGGRAGFISTCPISHNAGDDPIVFPGQPGAAHLHEFFGNTSTDAHTTTHSLITHGRTSCEHADDLSAYWAPAGIQGGRVAEVAGTSMYYFLDKVDEPKSTRPMPLGLRMIAGDATATEPPTKELGWFEEHRNARNNTRGNGGVMIRARNSGQVTMRVNFPNCWDGEHLDSPDHQSHMAYTSENDGSCPASHPVLVPQLTMFVRYDAPGGDAFELASGAWWTLHADFWNGWHPDTQQALIDGCLREHCDRVRTA